MTGSQRETEPDRVRPVIQESEFTDHVELVFPNRSETIVLGENVARDLVADLKRVVDP